MSTPRARFARQWTAMGVLAALTTTVAARADEPFELAWQAPPECPQRAAVRERIHALVPRAMLERARLRAEGTITRPHARFRLRLVMHFGDVVGERTIDSDSCGDLAGAAAVALGLLLESATPTEGSAEPSPSSSTSEPPAAQSGQEQRRDRRKEPEKEPASRDANDRDEPAGARSFRVFVHAPQGSVDIGPLPKASLALALGAGVRFRRWELFAAARLPTTQRADFSHSLSAELDHFAFSLETCRAFTAPPFELAPCVAFGLEHLRASGGGLVESPRSASASWLSAGVEVWARWYASDWFALAVGVGGRLQASRPTVQIDGISENQRLKPAAFSLRAGPMLLF